MRYMGSLGLTKEQRSMVIALLIGAVLVVLNQTLLSPALPSIMVHLQVDATTVQWLTSAYALTEAIVIPLAAWFMGRFTTRKLFIGCMTLLGLGSLVAAISPVFATLLLGRIMQAIATGIMMAMVMALILLSFPREKRGAAMGIVGLVIGFAPAIGPTVGGFLVDMIGWRALFFVVVALSVVVIVFAAKVLTNYEGFPRTKFDALSVVFSSLGLALLLYGLSSFASTDHVELCIGLIIFGIIFVALFARRQFTLEEPFLRLEVLKSRRYRIASITVFFLQATLIGLGVLMPLYIQNVLGFSATVSGLVTLPGAVLGALAGLWAGKMFDRHGVRKLTVTGVILLLVSGIGMFFYNAHSFIGFVIVVNMLCSLSVQFLSTPINTWGVNSLDNELVQHATSVTNTINQIGGSLGTALIMSFSAVGSSIATEATGVDKVFAGYHLSFGVVCAFLLLIFLIVLFCVRNRSTDQAPEVHTATLKKEGRHKVSDIMTTEVVTIPEAATMSDATEILARSGVSGAVVVSADRDVRGFVSNSDILRFFSDEMAVVSGASGGFTIVRLFDNEDVRDRIGKMAQIGVMEVATKKVVGINPDAWFEEACNLLAEKRLKELPVIKNGKLLGCVTRQDLMDFLAGAMHEEIKAARKN